MHQEILIDLKYKIWLSSRKISNILKVWKWQIVIFVVDTYNYFAWSLKKHVIENIYATLKKCKILYINKTFI